MSILEKLRNRAQAWRQGRATGVTTRAPPCPFSDEDISTLEAELACGFTTEEQLAIDVGPALHFGDYMLLTGLNKTPQLNGKPVEVISLDMTTRRFRVRVPRIHLPRGTKEHLAVRGANLKPAPMPEPLFGSVNMRTGVHTPSRHQNPDGTLKFAPDGRSTALGAEDGHDDIPEEVARALFQQGHLGGHEHQSPADDAAPPRGGDGDVPTEASRAQSTLEPPAPTPVSDMIAQDVAKWDNEPAPEQQAAEMAEAEARARAASSEEFRDLREAAAAAAAAPPPSAIRLGGERAFWLLLGGLMGVAVSELVIRYRARA